MKNYLTIFVLIFTFYSGFTQTREDAINLIEKDYQSLLEGICEFRNELRSTDNSNIISELKLAQKELIKDFIAGPYSIFDANAVVETAKMANSNKKSKDRVEAFLLNYAAKNYSNSKFTVDKIEQNDATITTVHFKSKGEVSNSEITRKAILIAENGNYKIRRISFDGQVELAAAKNIADKKGASKIINVSKATKKDVVIAQKEENVVIPTLTLDKPIISNDGELLLTGLIENGLSEGIISAYINGEFVPGLRTNIDKGTFSLSMTIPEAKSNELLLKYQYGNKFISKRNNIVIHPKLQSYSLLDIRNSEMGTAVLSSDHE